MCFALHLEYACVDRKRQLTNSTEVRTAIGYGSFDEAVAFYDQVLATLDIGRVLDISDEFPAIAYGRAYPEF